MSTSLLIPNPPKVVAPPFTLETATQKVRFAEDAWNSRDPDRVSLAYTEDSVWRNRSEFLVGRAQIRSFLAHKWARELDYRLVKALWAFTDNRIGCASSTSGTTTLDAGTVATAMSCGSLTNAA